MPKLMDPTQEQINTSSNYAFSAVKMDELGATEYTLVTLVVDVSSSLDGYDRDLESMIKEAVSSCQKSPRAENLMIRVVTFNQNEAEMHGFKLLENVQPDDYDQQIMTAGSTLLFDSVYHAIEATKEYGQVLLEQDYLANAIVFVITDGMDNESTYTASTVKDLISTTIREEVLESLAVVLIGMSGESQVQTYLDDFAKRADINEYIDMGDVSASKLAKLAGYISRSTTSTSQALGSGGPSQSLQF